MSVSKYPLMKIWTCFRVWGGIYIFREMFLLIYSCICVYIQS